MDGRLPASPLRPYLPPVAPASTEGTGYGCSLPGLADSPVPTVLRDERSSFGTDGPTGPAAAPELRPRRERISGYRGPLPPRPTARRNWRRTF